MNRKIAPKIHQLQNVNFIQPIQEEKKVNFFQIKNKSDESIRLELYFDAGSKYQLKKLQSSMVSSMLFSGTSLKKSREINNEIDLEGGYFQCESNKDFITLTLYCLSSKFDRIWDTIEDAILNANFPIDEFQNLVSIKKQEYKVNSEKVSTIARRNFSKLLFEKKSPYDSNFELKDFDSITIEDLISFHKTNILNGLKAVFLVGNLNNTQSSKLINFSNKLKSTIEESDFIYKNEPKIIEIEKEKALQSAIKIGKFIPKKGENDYIELQILNTVFGGYFGSRLMANIRENKGYTYGIGSGIVPQINCTYFFISTEVGIKVKENTLHEIKKEMEIIQSNLIPNSELNLVINYMQGQFLKSSDGPFSMMDKYKSLWFFDLNYSFYDKYIESLKSIDSNRLKTLANKYLNWNEMSVVVAG